MAYEVELKFPVADRARLTVHLHELAARAGELEHHSDTYFMHPDPARDFAKTNEAFRIRSIGEEHFLTYKGPVVDRQVKMRQEIEIGFDSGPAAGKQMIQLLTLLGFRPRGTVQKRRIPHQLHWEGRDFTITFDDVAGLGSFVEIETIAGDEEAERISARDACLNLAHRVGLSQPERRSYLTMVLQQQGESLSAAE
ncbi:MAG: class IV adenylate cyclase [Planctomycetaceae bacterium]